MKKHVLVLLLLVASLFSIGQSRSITLTVKTTIEQMSENAKTELITVDESNKPVTKQLPSIFSSTEEHEKLIQEEINKITTKGFELVDSAALQYGGVKGRYYLITRYVFKEHAK